MEGDEQTPPEFPEDLTTDVTLNHDEVKIIELMLVAANKRRAGKHLEAMVKENRIADLVLAMGQTRFHALGKKFGFAHSLIHEMKNLNIK